MRLFIELQATGITRAHNKATTIQSQGVEHQSTHLQKFAAVGIKEANLKGVKKLLGPGTSLCR